MKNKVIITVLLSILGLGSITAQNVVTYQLQLDKDKTSTTCFTKSKYYFKSFNRVGEKPNPKVEEAIEKYLITVNPPHEQNYYWYAKDWSQSVTEESDADFIITGEYNFNSGTNIGEKVCREKARAAGLPYFVTKKEHYANIDITFIFEYKDGSPTRKDTLSVYRESTETPGEKSFSVEKLEDQLNSSAAAKIADYKEMVDADEVQINFPKVKIKDKAIKAEYESLKGFLKEGEYEKAGSLVKKAYESNQTPELSQSLGICYELVGNYPKAAELHKALPNFHVNVRMKKNMAFLEYAQSIGFEPKFIEFK